MLAVLKDSNSSWRDDNVRYWDKDENNDVAQLEPAPEKASLTSTSFAYSTFGSQLGKVALGMVCWER